MLEIEKQKLHVPLRPSKTPTINQTTPMWAARSIDKMVHHSHSTHWPMFRPAFFDDPNEWRMAEVSRARSINSKRLAGIEKLPPLTFIFFLLTLLIFLVAGLVNGKKKTFRSRIHELHDQLEFCAKMQSSNADRRRISLDICMYVRTGMPCQHRMHFI